MKVFCIDINNSNYNKIKELNYIPVGLGQDNFDKIGLETTLVLISRTKIHIMENTLFITCYGKIILKKLKIKSG